MVKQKSLFGKSENSQDLNALEQADLYPYCQISKWLKAYKTQQKKDIIRAAQSVFYWPSFENIIKAEQKADYVENDEIDCISTVSIPVKKKKSKKRKKRIKGESVTDLYTDQILPIEVSSAVGKKPKKQDKTVATRKERKDTIIIQKETPKNWRDWNMNRKKITLSDYTNWLNEKSNSDHSDGKVKAKAKKKKKKKKSWIKNRVSASLSLKDEIISEPLAELLAEQEHFDEAIRMYEKLRLIFPEKSSFFAGKIEDLKAKK